LGDASGGAGATAGGALDFSDIVGHRRHASDRPEEAFQVAARTAAVLVPVSVLLATSGAVSVDISRVVDDIAQIAAGVFAAWSCAWTWRRARRSGTPGGLLAWRVLLFFGTAGWTCGQLVWSWYQLVGDRDIPSPSLADIGYFALPVFAVPALLALPTTPASTATSTGVPRLERNDRRAGLLVTLDSLVIVGSLFLLTWSTALGAAVHTGAPTAAAFAVAVGYPVTDLVMVVIVLLTAVFRRPRTPGALLLLGAGLVALSVSDSLFLYLVSVGASDIPTAYDIGFVAGPVLLGLAALLPESGERRIAPPVGSRRADTWFVFLPYLPLGGIGLLVILQQVSGLALDPIETYGLILLVGIVVVRQLLTLLENLELLSRVQESQDRLHHQAFHDWLTGLPNAALFRNRLEQAVERHRRGGHPLALLFCDLDDFKGVNDTLGHSVGDDLLRLVAGRLRQSVRTGDTVARLGGDEFAVILDDDPASPQAVGERVLAALTEPVTLAGCELLLRASAGLVVVAPAEDAGSADQLLHRADAAMYQAKHAGKGRLVVDGIDGIDAEVTDLTDPVASRVPSLPRPK
jgi:diguanylate cyclase (GGDEF)-like protein